ncbi:MAG: GNAT family N-acetyltransferase [Phycisphaerae bacterium]|nr:GNAT family N-acetyltransferase [Phycisphaerae bacterium]
MDTKLAEAKLKNGQTVDVRCVQPPAGEWTDRIAPFLAHKGEPWNWHIRTNLEGHCDELDQRFYIAAIGQEIVSHLMLVEKHGLAILGHVFTDAQWRQQGATSLLMKAMTEEFAARDGVAMHLFTGFESPAFRIYRRFGFEPMSPGSGRMKWVRSPERFEACFAPGDPRALRVEKACWTHWPLIHKLMLRQEGDWLRNEPLSLTGSADAENAFVHLMSRLREGVPNAAAVLVNNAGMTVGLATLLPWKALPSRMMIFDVYVHPTAEDALGTLIGAIDLPSDRPVLSRIDAESTLRRQALRDAGFDEVGRIKEALDFDGTDTDLILMQY